MRRAAHLVLDGEEHLRALRIDDVLEAVLDRIRLLADEPAVLQPAVRAGKVRDVDRDVMAVVRHLGLARLAEDQVLPDADLHLGRGVAVERDGCRRPHRDLIELRDPDGGVGPHVELHVRDAEGHVAELRPGGVEPHLVAPRAGDADVLVVGGAHELRPAELLARVRETHLQALEVGHDEADGAAEHFRLPGGHVELLLPGVDPHVLGAGHDVRVACEPEGRHVEVRRHDLVRDLHVDVLEPDDVAEVLCRPIEHPVACHCWPPPSWPPVMGRSAVEYPEFQGEGGLEFGLFTDFASPPWVSDAAAFVSLGQMRAAEDMGYDAVWLAEIHFQKDRSVLASPLVIAAALAACTRRVKIGIAVQMLPLSHPLRLAEDVATADHLPRAGSSSAWVEADFLGTIRASTSRTPRAGHLHRRDDSGDVPPGGTDRGAPFSWPFARSRSRISSATCTRRRGPHRSTLGAETSA